MTTRLFEDLDNLVKATNLVHQLNQTIVVDDGKIIIPGLQLTRFPIIQLVAKPGFTKVENYL